jgi:hypothetical protein
MPQVLPVSSLVDGTSLVLAPHDQPTGVLFVGLGKIEIVTYPDPHDLAIVLFKESRIRDSLIERAAPLWVLLGDERASPSVLLSGVQTVRGADDFGPDWTKRASGRSPHFVLRGIMTSDPPQGNVGALKTGQGRPHIHVRLDSKIDLEGMSGGGLWLIPPYSPGPIDVANIRLLGVHRRQVLESTERSGFIEATISHFVLKAISDRYDWAARAINIYV